MASYSTATATEGEKKRKKVPEGKLRKFMASRNIAEDMSDDDLQKIGMRVVREFDVDWNSLSDWRQNNTEAMKMAKQVMEVKNYPWPKSANIKYPLLTTAAIQFAARAYPAIVAGKDVVKGKINGKDDGVPVQDETGQQVMGQDGQPQWQVQPGAKRERADRVARHMSYQLTEEMEEWEEDTDRLLHVVPICGCAFRKTWFDPAMGRNRSELVLPDKLVVNVNTKSLSTVPRATQIIELYPHQIESRIRDKRFIDFDPMKAAGTDPNDDDAAHDFLEQHRYEDLDDDGMAEPYVVTVHKETSRVVRIMARYDEDSVFLNDADQVTRFEPTEYYTKYPFIPSPDGGFYDIGFGELLRPLSVAINTAINQMLDAGHLQNTGGGFIGSGLRIKGGATRFVPGEYKRVTATGGSIKDNIVPMVWPGASTTLFQLLGLLIESAKDISSVKDAMTGDAGPANEGAAKRLARIEQGMKVFSAIYKRMFRSLKKEYKKLFRLNALYLEPEQYFTFHDEPEAIKQDDYRTGDMDVEPAADPNMVTDMQRMAHAEFLMTFLADPHFEPIDIRQRILDAVGVPDSEVLLRKEMPPDPKVAQAADEIEIKKREIELRGQELQVKSEEMTARVAEIQSKIILNLAKAESEDEKTEIQGLKALTDMILARAAHTLETGKAMDAREANERKSDIDAGRVRGVAGQPGNGAGSQVPA